jgi:hypothetical protein
MDVFSYKPRRLGSRKNVKLMPGGLGSPSRSGAHSVSISGPDAKTHFQEKR